MKRSFLPSKMIEQMSEINFQKPLKLSHMVSPTSLPACQMPLPLLLMVPSLGPGPWEIACNWAMPHKLSKVVHF